jgi:hypothetical protein
VVIILTELFQLSLQWTSATPCTVIHLYFIIFYCTSILLSFVFYFGYLPTFFYCMIPHFSLLASVHFNPLPVQFKSLLHGQEGCIFFSGHLNLRTCQYVWVRLARQATFKFSTFWYVRAGKGLSRAGLFCSM